MKSLNQSKQLQRMNRSRDEEINRFSDEEIKQLKQMIEIIRIIDQDRESK